MYNRPITRKFRKMIFSKIKVDLLLKTVEEEKGGS